MGKEQDRTQKEDTENQPQTGEQDKSSEKPALVINVHTWATPIAGVVMLVVGLLLGYFGRPLISDQSESGSPPASSSVSSQSSSPAASGDLMNFLVGQTRHFKGSPDAPVTLIEFSDFK